ncbi:hypothetical protein QOT17_018028 [Balamuthia mandrillaris]
MTAIKESEWAKMFTKQQAKETVAEYEERLQLEMVGEFQWWMKFAKAHYFEKKCDDHCPHLERSVDLDSMDRCDCKAKETGNDGKEKMCDCCKKEYCDDSNGDPVWIEKIQKVKEKINSIVKKVDVFIHGYHTCHNENLNMCCTKDTPKDKNMPTFREQAFLSPLRRNLGGRGSATATVFEELGLEVTSSIQQHMDNLDEQEKRNRKRKQSKAFKKREQELLQQQKARAEQEKKISKKKGDAYLDKHQKSLAPVSEEDTHTKQKKQKTVLDLSVAKVSTVEEVSKLKGKALEAQLTLFGLFKTYKGDSTMEGQKKHLAEFVSDQSAFQHYLRPHKPQATAPHCSSPLPSAPFSVVVVARSRSSAV